MKVKVLKVPIVKNLPSDEKCPPLTQIWLKIRHPPKLVGKTLYHFKYAAQYPSGRVEARRENAKRGTELISGAG